MVVYIRVSQPLITAAFCFMGIKSRHGNTQCLVRLTGLEPATIRLDTRSNISCFTAYQISSYIKYS
jgi:hypothetical protein